MLEFPGSGSDAPRSAARAIEDDDEKLDAPLPVETLLPQVMVPEARVVHPIIWALQLWTVTSLLSLLVAPGLSEALRGAFVGGQAWILGIDDLAARLSQVAALCTTALLVYFALLCARASRHFLIGIGAALFGAAPTMVVFYAHKSVLPQMLTWVAALSGSFALLLAATQIKKHASAQTVAVSGGVTLLATALRTGGLTGDGSHFWSLLGGSLAGLSSLLALGSALFVHLWSQKKRPWSGALLFGATLVLALTVPASSSLDTPDWILLTGRSLRNLAPETVLGAAAPWAISSALLLVIFTLFARPASLVGLLAAFLALCCLAPASPLVIAWMTLCGYALVVCTWTPTDEFPRDLGHLLG